jgi:glycosyltransferase involved in cell wall biosynthesis
LGLASHPVDLLLRGFRQVIGKVPQAQLLLVGGGEDYDALVELSRQLGIEQQTFFAGRIPPASIPAYYALASLSVDPVYDDYVARARSPLKIFESLTMGAPVVTSDVGDRGATIQGPEDGVLVPAGSAEGLADGILQILATQGDHDRSPEAAPALREQWFWDKLVQDFLNVYSL